MVADKPKDRCAFGAAPGVTLFSVLQGANEQGSRGRVFVTRAQTEHGE
jgi:hypothetical protein